MDQISVFRSNRNVNGGGQEKINSKCVACFLTFLWTEGRTMHDMATMQPSHKLLRRFAVQGVSKNMDPCFYEFITYIWVIMESVSNVQKKNSIFWCWSLKEDLNQKFSKYQHFHKNQSNINTTSILYIWKIYLLSSQ